jgi:hypothetical protein
MAPGDSAGGGSDRSDIAVSQGLNIANWWLAKETPVLAVELAYTLVTDFIRRARRINSIHEHALPCRLQPELLLILERAHCRQPTELMVQRRHSHSRNCCKFLHVQWLGVVGPEPGDGSCGSVTEIAGRGDGAEASSLWASEDAVNDFALDQMAEKRYVLGSLEKLDQPGAGAQQADRGFTDSNSTALNGDFWFRKIFPAKDLPHCSHIESEKHRKQGDLF